jgi:hypothetical protein
MEFENQEEKAEEWENQELGVFEMDLDVYNIDCGI